MSSACRLATWNSRSRSWAGQDRVFGQRRSASPSFSGRSSVPQAGQCVGITNARSVAVAQVDDRSDDLRDHVAGLAQHDGVADQHALALHLAGVVQRRHADRRAGDQHRLHHPERRHPAGPPDVDADVEQLGGDLLRRVLVRDRPARRPRRRAELVLHRPLVELDHHAVDLVLDRVPVLAEVADVGPHLVQVRASLRCGLTGRPQRSRASYASDSRSGREALEHAEAVADEAQVAGRGDPRILLPQRSGRRVARVGERRLAVGDQRLVQRGELLDREEHLAADLEHVGRCSSPG